MYTIRPIERSRRADFAQLDGAADIIGSVDELWSSGASKPEWCFVLDRDDRPAGRAGIRVSPTCPAEFLGDLPPEEAFLFGLDLPWEDDDWLDLGLALLHGVAEQAPAGLPEVLQTRLNPEWHDHIAPRRELLETSGSSLFQEKQGHYWKDDGSTVEVPSRLAFRPIDDVGTERFRKVLGRCGAGTLDRNDAWYRKMAHPDNWSSVFMTMLGEGDDRSLWLLGTLPDGEDVGFVALNGFDDSERGVPDTATISFIGVVPEHRGNGYIDDLLLAGTGAAQGAGFAAILSDVDTVNFPMQRAMERCGHRSDVRPWHVWHYRTPLVRR